MRPADHNSLCMQNFQGFANRNPADVQLARDLDLDNSLTLRDRSRSNPFDDGIRDLVGQASRMDESKVAGLMSLCSGFLAFE